MGSRGSTDPSTDGAVLRGGVVVAILLNGRHDLGGVRGGRGGADVVLSMDEKEFFFFMNDILRLSGRCRFGDIGAISLVLSLTFPVAPSICSRKKPLSSPLTSVCDASPSAYASSTTAPSPPSPSPSQPSSSSNKSSYS